MEGGHGGNLSLSFILTAAAGACASLGGAVVFLPIVSRPPQPAPPQPPPPTTTTSIEDGADATTPVAAASGGGQEAGINREFVALAFSLSAGLMLFVSFTDTFAKALEEFRAGGMSHGIAMLATGGAFFFGVALVAALERGVDILMAAGGCAFLKRVARRTPCARCPCSRSRRAGYATLPAGGAGARGAGPVQQAGGGTTPTASDVDSGDGTAAAPTLSIELPPVNSTLRSSGGAVRTPLADMVAMPASLGHPLRADDAPPPDHPLPLARPPSPPPLPAVAAPTANDSGSGTRAHMEHVGLVAVITLSLTNIPEGIAAFVSTMADTRTGAVVSLATAIESALEGSVIAIPMYYGTGSRLVAFAAAAVSGIAAPVGSLLAWGALAANPSRVMFGTLFGMVSGSLVWVTLRELIPNALQQDPSGRITRFGFLGGMALVLASNSLTAIGGA